MTDATPEAAAAQRAELMADAGFRERAAKGGAEWQQLADLNRIITAAADYEEDEPVAPQAQQRDEPQGDEADFDPAYFEPPATPSDYQLPLRQAQDAGLAVDFAAEQEVRAALHGAGVDQSLASCLYTAAITSASAQRSDVELEGERITTERELRQEWGADYDANVALATREARRIFEAMPRSVTNGHDFESWVEQSGLGSNKALIRLLRQRAR